MYRVLFHTDAMFLKSGLARCARENIVRFHQHPEFEVFQAGWHHIGIPHDFPVPIFPIEKMHPGESERLYQIIQQVRPHFVVSVGDPFYFPWLRDLKKKIAKHLKHRVDWLGWITIDGDPLQAIQLSHILPFDRVMLMSRFSRRQVLNSLDLVKEGHPSYKDLPDEDCKRLSETHSVLYPGVNADQFRPRTSTWNHPSLGPINRKTKFVVSVVDQNTSRKAIGLVIDAFADFKNGIGSDGKKGKPREEAFLYLATDPNDTHGTNLDEIAKYHGLTENDYFFQMNSPIGGISDDEMANIYAISSFHMTCTSGEGFKLSILEAMISGCLTAMPDYSTGEELLGEKRGLLINTSSGRNRGPSYWYGTNNYRKVVVAKGAAIEVLEKAYHYWSDRSEKTGAATEKELYAMLQRAQQFALQWTWDKCFGQIVETMMSLYEDMPEVKVA